MQKIENEKPAEAIQQVTSMFTKGSVAKLSDVNVAKFTENDILIEKPSEETKKIVQELGETKAKVESIVVSTKLPKEEQKEMRKEKKILKEKEDALRKKLEISKKNDPIVIQDDKFTLIKRIQKNMAFHGFGDLTVLSENRGLYSV